MFTLEQIKKAHDKVQTGADFPNYIQDLINLGVKGYDTIVNDGRVAYYGDNDYSASTDKKYDVIKIASNANKERFIEFLVMHQDGQTDYFTFCQQAAQSGIAKWRVDIIEMTCTYFDTAGDAIVIEKIPN
ncbi:DUF1398 domain-containing protein [Flavobacterium frigoris]|uniref:Uncharacterized conserved protein YbcV, DUF1398 family n=1 Tax=Flavobacterium frigoris TaxID=229204 RepID=A0A1H9MMR2_FLAFI|nr:DUF1398 family protein [Flavobacterium frigoris]SER24982.1 Uncharacterized conserved protein YbcV, DUF1398 family [Flavobacterium frigoris]